MGKNTVHESLDVWLKYIYNLKEIVIVDKNKPLTIYKISHESISYSYLLITIKRTINITYIACSCDGK